MEKTIKWESNEAFQMQQVEQQKTQVLAQIGALMMDLENAKKNLESVNEKHKSAIQQALIMRGISQFNSARPVPGGIILDVVDMTDNPEVKPNGGV